MLLAVYSTAARFPPFAPFHLTWLTPDRCSWHTATSYWFATAAGCRFYGCHGCLRLQTTTPLQFCIVGACLSCTFTAGSSDPTVIFTLRTTDCTRYCYNATEPYSRFTVRTVDVMRYDPAHADAQLAVNWFCRGLAFPLQPLPTQRFCRLNLQILMDV